MFFFGKFAGRPAVIVNCFKLDFLMVFIFPQSSSFVILINKELLSFSNLSPKIILKLECLQQLRCKLAVIGRFTFHCYNF